MNKKTIVALITGIFIELPIQTYLFFWVLSQLNPDRLIWFLFWCYVPVVFLCSILARLLNGEKS